MSGAAVFRRQPRRAPIPPPAPGVLGYAVAKTGSNQLTAAGWHEDREDAEAELEQWWRERGRGFRLVEIREVT